MIFYRPTDGDPEQSITKYRPRTAFIITKLGNDVPDEILQMRQVISDILGKYLIKEIDAGSKISGRDFLLKIWKMIISVPLGIAIINEEITTQTSQNIFYEIGMLQAYGKETLVVKSSGVKIPSDFVRTEYVTFDDNFRKNFEKYIENTFLMLPEHFEEMSDLLEKNPLLAIDYLKRAYLISGEKEYKKKAKSIFNDANIIDRAKNSVEILLSNF